MSDVAITGRQRSGADVHAIPLDRIDVSDPELYRKNTT